MSVFGSATLVLEGPHGGVQIEITPGKATLGRTSDNDVVLTDPAASSHHCELIADEVGLSLRDLGSSNGTFVNGKRVAETVKLSNGDLVRIGQSQGRVQIRSTDGKLMHAKGGKGPLIVVAAVVLIVALGGIALKITVDKKNAERALFGKYDSQAQALLTKESLCRAVSKPRIDLLKAIDGKVAHPVTATKGALSADDKAQDQKILDLSKERADKVKEDIDHFRTALAQRDTAVDGLRHYATMFADPDLASAVKALDLIFAQQHEIAQEYLKGWQDYAADVAELNTELDALLKADEKAQKGASEKLDAFAVKTHPDPEKLRDACETAYAQTIQTGVQKLAGLQL
jgi:hypothetical protein